MGQLRPVTGKEIRNRRENWPWKGRVAQEGTSQDVEQIFPDPRFLVMPEGSKAQHPTMRRKMSRPKRLCTGYTEMKPGHAEG